MISQYLTKMARLIVLFLDNILYYPVKLLFEEIKYNRQNLEDLFTVLSNSVEHYKTYSEIDDENGKNYSWNH